MFKKIAIIGMGLMGGSLGLAVKKNMPQTKVYGFARNQKSLVRLKKLNLVDLVSTDLDQVLAGADLVVLGLPVDTILEYLDRISLKLNPNAIVIDLGSTKDLIQQQAKKCLPKNVSFVGCHPLCGSDKAGAKFSRPDLYLNQLCLITSLGLAGKKIKKFWESLGSQVKIVDAKQHDKMLSGLSHLTHAVSFAYTDFIDQKYLKFSMPSLKDMTRISNSSAYVWADILLSNRTNVLADMNKFKGALAKIEKFLLAKDKIGLIKYIESVNKKQGLIQ